MENAKVEEVKQRRDNVTDKEIYTQALDFVYNEFGHFRGVSFETKMGIILEKYERMAKAQGILPYKG